PRYNGLTPVTPRRGSMRVRRQFAFAVAAIGLAALLTPGRLRADDWPVKRGPANDVEAYRYDAKAWAAVPREFLDDYSACVLYSSTSHRIDADGTVETITHEITRLNGRKGSEALSEHRN